MAQNGLRHAATDATSTAPVPDTDSTFRLLADDERRTLLAELRGSGSVDVDDLRDRIAEDDDDRLHADIRLHHVHLPKLADAGFVDHDADAETVTATASGRKLATDVGC